MLLNLSCSNVPPCLYITHDPVVYHQLLGGRHFQYIHLYEQQYRQTGMPIAAVDSVLYLSMMRRRCFGRIELQFILNSAAAAFRPSLRHYHGKYVDGDEALVSEVLDYVDWR